MNNPLISVIMPVYNAQNTIKMAINCLQKQTIKDIEILIIDDCSTDNTAKIITEIAQTDNRVKYICMDKNSGPGVARNVGLEKANGEYIGFMDADDIIVPDMFEKLYSNSKDADIVVCGYMDAVLTSKEKPDILAYTKLEKSDLITDRTEILKSMLHLDKNRLFAFLWNKLYRKDILNGKKFPAERLNEDYCFNCSVWEDITSLKIIDDCLYYYIDYSNGSLSRKFVANYFEIMCNKYLITKKLFDDAGLFTDDIRSSVCNMHIKHLLAGFSKLFFKESGLIKKQIRQKIKEILQHETCIEACKFAQATRKQEALCNFILSSGNIFLIYSFSLTIFILKNKVKSLFGKIK